MISTQARVFTPDTLAKEEVFYKIDVLQKSVLCGFAEDFYIQYHVKKEWIRTLESGDDVYVIEVLEREHNSKTELRALEADIATFTKRVALQVDKTGKPIHILNQYAIAEAWQDHRKAFYKKHKDFEGIDSLIEQTDDFVCDGQQILDSFLESVIGMVLFPPLYQSTDTLEKRKDKRVFSECVGNEDIPLILTNNKISYDREKQKYTIRRNGALDQDQYNTDGVNDFFTGLVNSPIKTDIEVSHVESYDFDTSYWITHAFMMLDLHIKGLFDYQQIIRVQPNPETL